MALFAKHNEVEFGVGDKIKVVQKIKEGDKSRSATFEGMVISIHGRNPGLTFTVRRIGDSKVGIERIFPVSLPTIEKVEVVKHGTAGVEHAKLYYTREKSAKEIDRIYTRNARKNHPDASKKKR